MEPFDKNSLKRHRQQDRRMGREAFEIFKDYSEYSTIQGILYIFQPNQTTFGKIFWIAVVVFMFMLGAFWSVEAYNGWQDNPVITTVGTTAYPIKRIEFPAVTICGQGNNEEILAAGFLKMFSDFLSQKGVNLGISPIKGAKILMKSQFMVNKHLKNLIFYYNTLKRRTCCKI
jgi:hypothetical protein